MSQFAERGREADISADPIHDHAEAGAVDAADQRAASHLSNAQIQMRFGGPETSSAEVRDAAAEGVKGTPSALPHGDRIQASFGHHDISGVKAHVGEQAAAASEAMGANAFATGSSVGFAGQPDLHTAAHEAAHVVQQRGGVQLKDGVGEAGDRYEENADRAADQVVDGKSAEAILDSVVSAGSSSASTGAVQHDKTAFANARAAFEKPAKPRAPRPISPQARKRILAKGAPKKKVAPPKRVAPPKKSVRSHEARRGMKAPPKPPQKVAPPKEELEPEVVTPPVVKPVVEDETTKANKEAKESVELGAHGVEFLEGGVEKSKEAWEEEKSQPKPEPKTAPAAKKKKKGGIFGKIFRGIKSIFSSKSSVSETDEFPFPDNMPGMEMEAEPEPAKNSRMYDEVKGKLGTLKTKLLTYVPKLDTAISTGTDMAQKYLTKAKTKVDTTAEEIKGKVEEHHVFELQDIGVGIISGTKEMLKGAIERGKITFNAINITSKLGSGGSDAIVFNGMYMDMVELAYKTGKTGEEDDKEHEMVKENRIMRMFNDKNMLKSGGQSERAKRPGYAMEKAAFGDLEQVFLNMNNGMPTAEGATAPMAIQNRLLVTRYLIRGAFRALKLLHDKNIVHGDIKHQNFLLGDDMETKMMDFGMSHDEDDESTVSARSGTGAFMAPEVVAGGYSKKPSDIWSLGETLLYGIFDWDSVDFLEGAKKKGAFNKEMKRPHMTDKDWQDNFEAKAAGLEGKVNLISFVKGAMAKDPGARMTADAALAHPFLDLKGKDETDAQKLLKTVV